MQIPVNYCLCPDISYSYDFFFRLFSILYADMNESELNIFKIRGGCCCCHCTSFTLSTENCRECNSSQRICYTYEKWMSTMTNTYATQTRMRVDASPSGLTPISKTGNERGKEKHPQRHRIKMKVVEIESENKILGCSPYDGRLHLSIFIWSYANEVIVCTQCSHIVRTNILVVRLGFFGPKRTAVLLYCFQFHLHSRILYMGLWKAF